MAKVEFYVDIRSDLETVMEHFWELESWPRVARHVTRVDMLYRNDAVQVITMHVETGERKDAFMSVRIRQPGRIFYFQPRPPAAMHRHYGWWYLEQLRPDLVRVTSEHSLDLNLEKAARFLASSGAGSGDPDKVEQEFCQVIHNNSLQTMQALKDLIEAGEDHAQRLAS